MKLVNLFKKSESQNVEPVVSLIGTAIRTNLWMEFYKSLESNSIPFEIIFVGSKIPSFKLPHNFKFIFSKVKPVQCLEIAARRATGEFLMIVADDCILSTKAIDKMYTLFKKIGQEQLILSGRWVKYGKDMSSKKSFYFINDINSPILPVCAFMKRTFWHDLGGLDRRFIASCADCDLAMRAYQMGGNVILCNDVFYHERKKMSGGINLYPEFGKGFDRPLLDSFWVKNGAISKKRLIPFLSFSEKNLLKTSQGRRGRW